MQYKRIFRSYFSAQVNVKTSKSKTYNFDFVCCKNIKGTAILDYAEKLKILICFLILCLVIYVWEKRRSAFENILKSPGSQLSTVCLLNLDAFQCLTLWCSVEQHLLRPHISWLQYFCEFESAGPVSWSEKCLDTLKQILYQILPYQLDSVHFVMGLQKDHPFAKSMLTV